MNNQFDVIFIGSGHAAWHGAATLSQSGKRVAIIDGDLIGGTCTNYGCDAKILLDGPSELNDQVKRYGKIAFENELQMNWQSLMQYKHAIIDPLPMMLKARIEQAGIQVIEGFASFLDAHTLKVGENEVTGDIIVIATGQKTNRLNIAGKEFMIDSRQFLSLPELPKSIVFVGGGVISLEFAAMLIPYGVDISVVEYGDTVLREFNQEHVQMMRAKLEEEGVRFILNAAAERVEQSNGKLRLYYNQTEIVDAQVIVDATGRIANTDNLNLEHIGVASDRGGIIVNEYMQTSIANIFASGDVVSKQIPRLTPTATFESNYIASYLLKETTAPISYPVVPMSVFTLPRIARVGVSEKMANEAPDQYDVISLPYGQLLAFQMKNELDATMKLVVDRNKRLVGAEIVGQDAGEVINILAMVIELQLSGKQIQQLIFAFPTQVGSIMNVVTRALL